MLLGSPPDMVHRAPAHGAHIRMQNSAIYSPVRFKYYTIPFGKLQVAVGGWGRKFLLKRFDLKSSLFIVLGPCTSLFYTTNTESTFLLQNVAITKPAWTPAPPPQQTAGVIVR